MRSNTACSAHGERIQGYATNLLTNHSHSVCALHYSTPSSFRACSGGWRRKLSTSRTRAAFAASSASWWAVAFVSLEALAKMLRPSINAARSHFAPDSELLSRDAINQYRHLNVLGHVCRLSDEHVVTDAVRWRNLAWWREFRENSPTRMGGQPGRRGADYGNPCRAELHVSRSFGAHARTPREFAVIAALTSHRPIRQWSDLALFRREHRDFSRWAAFPDKDTRDDEAALAR